VRLHRHWYWYFCFTVVQKTAIDGVVLYNRRSWRVRWFAGGMTIMTRKVRTALCAALGLFVVSQGSATPITYAVSIFGSPPRRALEG
jgi:hypothetical protein